ncbi:MAG: restriction endonuclease subunit S [Kiritimatiellia bacterium]
MHQLKDCGVSPLSSEAHVFPKTSEFDEAKSSRMIPLIKVIESRVEQSGPQSQEFVYVDIGCIDRETKRIVDPKLLPLSKAPSRAKQLLKTGDVLVSMTRPNLNAVAIVPPDLDGSIGSTGFHVLRARDAEPAFLFYAVQSNEFIDAMCLKVQGALYPAVRPRDISSFCIPPLSLAQQRRIVAEIEKQFTRLEAGVSALKRVQANLKRYRAAVLKAACEGKLVPTEAELQKAGGRGQKAKAAYETGAALLARILAERRKNWQGRGKYKEPVAPDTAKLPPLPEGWAWASVEQLAAHDPNSITDGPFGSNLKTAHYMDSGPRVIRLQNIGDGVYIDEEAHITQAHFERLQKHRIFAGDVVIAGFGENPPRSCIIPESLGPAIVKADCIRFKTNNSVLPKYMNNALNSEPVRKRTKGMVHGVGRPRLNLGEIKSIILPIPPLAEQTRIVAEVERRLSVVEELEATVSANLQRATRLRQAVLQRAFTGELV